MQRPAHHARRFTHVPLAAIGLAALAITPPSASAIWLYAPLTSGKGGDAGVFGASYVSVEGDRALISDGSFGAFSMPITYTGAGSGMSYTREQVTSSTARGVALLNGEAWVACGTELRRYSRLGVGCWILQQSWNLNNTVYDVAADGNVVVCSYAVSAAGGGVAMLEKRSGVWSMYDSHYSSVDYFGEHVDVVDQIDFALVLPPYTITRNSRVIVSGRGSDSPSTNAGAAYIYQQADDDWNWSATLQPSAPAANDEFGAEVALDGDYAYVSNLGSGGGRGQVVAFQSTSAGWSIVNTVSPSWAGATFGQSLDADQDRVVIGRAGTAYLYARSGSAWSWSTTFASRASSDPTFAGAVAIDGSSAVVGGGIDATGAGTSYFFGEP